MLKRAFKRAILVYERISYNVLGIYIITHNNTPKGQNSVKS